MERLAKPAPPWALEHDLARHFDELSQFNSSRALRRSTIWKEIEGEVRRVMNTVVQEDFANGEVSEERDRIRATAWNIERGNCFEGILEVLQEHPEISRSDLFLITEVDHGMARSDNRLVARDLARELGFNYVFVPCYISLVKGSGLEYHVEGENSHALHGNALFSRYPIRNAHSIALPNGKDKMRGKEKRLGYQQVALATVEHPQGDFHAVSLHLDAHSSQRHRHRQMKLVLDHLDRLEPLPVLIGGDWNTTTFNAARATYSIMGYARRVLMGVRNVVENHYPHPDRWFERRLFGELEKRGYSYKDLNQPGGCTLHYDIDDIAVNTNMADWVPGWCFWFIEWAVQRVGGNCSLKLDWFAGRDLQPANHGHRPRVIEEVHSRQDPLSDHDPILVDVELK
ncbi:MAG TPA: endonuclease/exonuclease/phosphatase family protein [Acidobacteriota bacterium]|nr:endonuclease/exonuclease/phosphatase family protein [Acidobacteriota bacterium]